MISQTDILLRILVAALLGAVIGYERERQSQPAGLRTHIVLVVGAALAMCLSISLPFQYGSTPSGDPARLAAQVLSGIGFLGAGAILRFGPTVKGLTTAASLWTMAVVGMAVGAGYYLAGVGVTGLLLVVLIALTWVEAHLITPSLTVQFTIYAFDRAGVARLVRETLQRNSREVEYVRMNRHIHRQRVRVEALVKLHGEEALEKLSQELAEINGVKVVKYE
jgi:putative Mg2+ transporter-C (MgtC) family protein